MTKRFTLMAFFCLLCLKIFAQQPSGVYLRSMNSLLPGSPQSAEMMKYQDYPVSLFTGTPEISVPIYTCVGKGISVPINISYHAGGGVKVDELPTEVGLGFSLIAGGEITRDMRGGADEGGGSGGGFMSKPYPMATYVDDFNCCMGTSINQQRWVEAMNGMVDLEPDIFYFSFGNHSGKFVWNDSLNQFVGITENEHLNITLDRSTPATVFTIITDEGNKYIFANRESTSSIIENKGNGGGTTISNPTNTTAWKLSKIINADGTDSIMLNYVIEHYSYYSGGSCINYLPGPNAGPGRNPVLSFSNNTIDGMAHLSNISGANFSVDFADESSDRHDVIGDRALAKIVVKNSNLDTQDIFVLNHSYFNRTNPVGPIPMTGNYATQSLRLDSISEYGNSLSNLNPLTHAFTYNSQYALPGRLSYQQDWWGYPNSNLYGQSLVPDVTAIDNVTHPGADRTPDLDRISAGILTGIRLPTGGTVTYEYEPNTTATAVEQSKPDPDLIIPIQQAVIENIEGSSAIFHDSILTFTVNEPIDALNGYEGGVVATVGVWPQATVDGDSYMPHWTISKISEVNGAPPYPTFTQTLQTHGLTDIHMPNGIYQARMWIDHYNQNLPPLQPLGPTGVPYDDGSPQSRTAGMTIGYNIRDNSRVLNYSLAGVRVKKITTTDPYSTVTNTRTFRYHNPVNDSSYGVFIGSARNAYLETSSEGYQWMVYQGSYNLPGVGNNASSVIYPKVIEDVSVNGIIYRTEHYFSRGVSIYPTYPIDFPFTPSEDLECARGNEYKTNWDKQITGNFTIAKTKIQVFDSAPHLYSNPAINFPYHLVGIRCAAASYDVTTIQLNGYAPTFVSSYLINVGNRLYLASDSVITYDLVNPYNGVKEWHEYTYGDYNHKPIISRTGNSDGTVSIQKNYYASDQPEANAALDIIPKADLIAANRIDESLGNKQYKGSTLLSQQYTYVHLDDKKLLVDSVRQSIFNNPLDIEIKPLQYDDFGNPLTIELRGHKYRKYLWKKEKGLPLASCVTVFNDDFFYFTSFEYPEDGGSQGFLGNIFSGNFVYTLANNHPFTINTPSLNNYDVYFWAATNTAASIMVNNGVATATGKVRHYHGNWAQYKAHITGGATSVTLSVSGMASIFAIDDLIIIPTGSQFQGVVYDGSNRVVATINDQIEATLYEYDPFGRLTIVRDEQGNITKSTTYQYQAAQ